MNAPLSVVVTVVINEGNVLLINRNRGAYVGLWGIPGGKVELDEHIREGAERKVQEEAGIETAFLNHLGIVSEHLLENGELKQHFLLHVCTLSTEQTDIIE